MEPLDVSITDYQDMVRLFHDESDRGAAVLAGSYVETHLGLYLKSHMADDSASDSLFSSNGALSSFSQRIDVAHAFGLITPVAARELHTIRKIRNYFAHHPKNASFGLAPVKDWVANLTASIEMPMPDGQKFKLDDSKLAYLISAGMFVAVTHNEMVRRMSGRGHR